MVFAKRTAILSLIMGILFAFGLTESKAQVTRKWVAQSPGFRAVDVEIDASGFVYVTGLSPLDAAHNFRHDIVTIKYDQNGNEVWKQEFDETDDQTNGDDTPDWLALDPSGNVIVTGRSFINSTGDDIIVLKYDPNGNLLWKARTTTGVEGERVETDSAGNIYVGGKTTDASTRDFITVKYDGNGNELWFRTYNGPNNFTDQLNSLAVSPSGEAVVTGESTGGVTSFDFATVFYEPDGTQRWVERYTSPGNEIDSGKDVALGPNGEVYVFGYSDNGSGSNVDFTLIKYDQAGNQIWVRLFNDPNNRGDIAHRLVVDSAGDIIETGVNGISQILTVKYNPSGNLLWARTFDDPAGEDFANAITAGSDNAIYVTGESAGRVATIKYDANGNEIWNDIFSNTIGPDRGYNIAVDSNNNVAVAAQAPILTLYYTQTPGGNQPPTATITDPQEDEIFPPGATVNFAGEGTDPEDGILPASAFTWTVTHIPTGKSKVIATGVKSGSFTAPPQLTGDIMIELDVVDSQGATGTDVVTITIGNQPPTATITSPQEGAVFFPGETVNYAGDGTDPEDGTLPASAFTWTATHVPTGNSKVIATGVKSGSLTTPPQLTGDIMIELEVVDSQGATGADTVTITFSTSAPEIAETESLQLEAFPNPFNPTTNIQFNLSQSEAVTLRIYNTLGQEVRTLVDGKKLAAGSHTVQWNSRNNRDIPVPTGIYYLQIQAGPTQLVQQLSLVK